MFWKKKERPEEEKPVRRRWIRKSLKYFSLFLLTIFVAILGFAGWITQSESGQSWLVSKLNPVLAAAPGEDAHSCEITSLRGSIPFNFSFGITLSDKKGLWLEAPDNQIVWNLKSLPGTIHFSRISADRVNVSRLPELPPEKETAAKKEEKPLTAEDVQKLLKKASDFLSEEHWWLPALELDELRVNALLPAELLPDAGGEPQRLAADARARFSFVNNRASFDARANIRNGADGLVSLPSFSFDQAGVDLSGSAGPAREGLECQLALQGDIAGPVLDMKDIPHDLAGDEISLSLKANAAANTGSVNPGLSLSISGPDLQAGYLGISGNGNWATDNWKNCEFSGPLAYVLNLAFEPVKEARNSPLAALKSPLKLKLAADGSLPRLTINLDLDCQEIVQAGHEIQDTRLRIAANDFDVPLSAAQFSLLDREHEVSVNLASVVDKKKLDVATDLFLQALETDAPADGWRAGLRNLKITAPGMESNGNIAALLPKGQKPALDGALKIEIRDWTVINAFVPDQKLSGKVEMDIRLLSVLAPELASPERALASTLMQKEQTGSQKAEIRLNIPEFRMTPEDGRPVVINRLTSVVDLSDVFSAPVIKAELAAGAIAAAGMKLSAQVKASGPIKGPLVAEISSKGSVNSRIGATWQPGEAVLSALEVTADLAPFLGKKATAGIRSAGRTEVRYGDAGIQVSGLDLRLLPAGRLRASGGMSPEKLDLKLSLEDLNLGAWQKIVPQLPTGSAALTASLRGSPKNPGGNFRLSLNKVAVPGAPIAPVSAALAGAIEHGARGSALRAKLELDPATVKTLGGTAAQVAASLPLVFGPDGVPKPDMKGPLTAKVRWDGSIGPIWNLLPIPDRRLNGRININLDAGGSLEKPQVKGEVAVSRARYEDLLLGVLLTDINLRLELFDDGRKKAKGALDSLPGSLKLALNISDGLGGSVTANGGGNLDGSDLAIKARIDKLRPLRRRDIHIQLSGNAQVSGSALAPIIDGEIIVDKGEVLLNNIAMTGSVTTLNIANDAKKTRKPAAAPQAPAKEGGKLNVRINMLPRFSVEGRGLASLWQANMLVAGPLNDPKITGNISCVRGNFDFLGKLFALTRGIVFFGGGSISNPLVDIEMTYDTPDLVAHILVDGPVNKIRLSMSSDPSMPRDEILSRVLFGRSLNDLSRMEALQLAGAVAQLAGFGGGSGPLSFAKKALGVDVLRIGTANTGAENQTTEETGGGTTLEMGKYINDYIYMGVQQGFKADSTAFIIEIELTPRTSFELRTEQNNTWGGIRWKMNY